MPQSVHADALPRKLLLPVPSPLCIIKIDIGCLPGKQNCRGQEVCQRRRRHAVRQDWDPVAGTRHWPTAECCGYLCTQAEAAEARGPGEPSLALRTRVRSRIAWSSSGRSDRTLPPLAHLWTRILKGQCNWYLTTTEGVCSPGSLQYCVSRASLLCGVAKSHFKTRW